jgi:hypothetical protein
MMQIATNWIGNWVLIIEKELDPIWISFEMGLIGVHARCNGFDEFTTSRVNEQNSYDFV